jgi:NADH-quinone oxidoreductase subunit A
MELLNTYIYKLYNKLMQISEVIYRKLGIYDDISIAYHANVQTDSEQIFNGMYTYHWSNPDIWINFIFICHVLLFILCILPYILSPKKTNIEKNSAYECGFAPFFIKEGVIEIQFLAVALLFLIFDLEVIYMVPFALNIGDLGSHTITIFIIYTYVAWLMLAIEGVCEVVSWPSFLNLSIIKKKN